MALYTPPPLEPGWDAALRRAARRAVDDRALAVIVERLSRKYNGEDVALARGDELLARTLFWFARDVHKVALPAVELLRTGALPRRPLRALDVGAGTGATSLGLVRALAQAGGPAVASITAVDSDADALAVLRRVADEAARDGLLPAGTPGAIETRAGNLATGDGVGGGGKGAAPYDLVLLGSVLVEVTRGMGDEAARGAAIADHVAHLVERAPLAPDGALVVIEPALRDATRALHHARARLLERGLGVFAPCTHALACPMLANDRDWCHEDLPVDLPPWLVPVARAAGLRWQGLTFSYLVVRRGDARSVRELVTRDAPDVVPVRLVSQPRRTKGKSEAFASGDVPAAGNGPRLMQLDRDVRGAEPAASLAELRRGDVVGVAREAVANASGKNVRVGAADLVAAAKRE